MKKLVVLTSVLLILLMLPVMALAITQEEWNQDCRAKTSNTTTLYAIENDPTATDTALLKEIGSLPGGTYVKTGQYDYDLKMWKIAYLKDGSLSEAWVEKNKVVGAYTIIYLDNGGHFDVPEAVAKDTDALLRLLKKMFPDRSYSAIPGSSTLHVDMSSERAAAGKGQRDSAAAGKDQAVTVKELGTHMSKVSIQGKVLYVPTAELSFGKDVPDNKRLAVIYTPKTGKAGLRASAQGHADIIKQCKAGTLVSVLEMGKTYTKINYKNTVGYVQTDCLKFIDAAAETASKGVLSYKGKTTGGTTVNIRLQADGGSRKIGEMRTGTEVTVFALVDGWYEIEAQGIRGYVMQEYLVVKE